MSESNLTQAEADALIAMAKRRVDDSLWRLPITGGRLSIALMSLDRREQFALDVYRGRINLAKGTYQNRGRHVVVLVRLDFGGSPHRNPDGAEIPSPHLHLFREGFADKWAIAVPAGRFSDIGDQRRTLQDFMAYCNIVEPPNIDHELFS